MKHFVKSDVLASVRNRYGYPLRVFAEKIKEEPETVREWESKGAELSTSKMELVADAISCHWSVLLRDDPLPKVDRPKSKRAANGRSTMEPESSTLIAYRESYKLLDNIFISALPTVSNRISTIIDIARKSGPEKVAVEFRKLAVLSHETRHKFRDQRAVYNHLVDVLERNGIFVSEQELDTEDIRGFLISREGTFLIVVSSLDKFPASKLFTLLHEVGHILRGSHSSACDLKEVNGDLAKVDGEEKFCDSFAAAVLMPKDEFVEDKRVEVARLSTSNDALSKLATSYRTSYLAVVRRLYSLELISYDKYRKKTKEFYEEIFPQIMANMKKNKSDDFILPRSYYVNKEVKKAGKSFTDFVIDKYSHGDIGSGEAKRLLNVDTRYLVEIQKMVETGK